MCDHETFKLNTKEGKFSLRMGWGVIKDDEHYVGNYMRAILEKVRVK